MSNEPRTERPARTRRVPRYFATHEGGLRNGSFFRVWDHYARKNQVAQFVNGDYMGYVDAPKAGPAPEPPADSYFGIGEPNISDGLPTTYCGSPLIEYRKNDAEQLIPACCGGRP